MQSEIPTMEAESSVPPIELQWPSQTDEALGVGKTIVSVAGILSLALFVCVYYVPHFLFIVNIIPFVVCIPDLTAHLYLLSLAT